MALPPYFLLCVLLFTYRVELYHLASPLYHGISSDGFVRYLLLSSSGDAVLASVSYILFAAVFFVSGSVGRRGFVITAAVLTAEMAFLQLGIEFFRTYERSFHPAFFNDENRTAFFELAISALSEFSWTLYLKTAVFTAVIAALSSLSYRLTGEAASKLRGFADKVHAGTIAAILPLVAVLAFWVPGIAGRAILDRGAGTGGDRAAVAVAEDLASNPVVNLFTGFAEPNGGRVLSAGGTGERFGPRLDTASLHSGKVFGSIGVIPGPRRYNVIFYFFESTPHRYLDIKIGGRHVMETWQGLMKHSFIAERHYANYPLSANALLNVLCSSYGIFSKSNVIQEHPSVKIRSLPEILHDRGYRTFLIHTGELGYAGQNRFLKHRKFDTILDLKDLEGLPPYNRRVGWGLDERVMIEPSVRYALKDPERPFFMVYMPVNPHHPYAIPGDEFDITGPLAEGGEKKQSWYRYLNSLHFADRVLGDLMAELDKNGLLENTLVFVFGDHGEAFYQHRMNYNHPFFLYEENVHVPFIIYNKSIFQTPYRYNGISRHIDIAPTLLYILGFPESRSMEGIPLTAGHREQMALLHTYWKDEFMGLRDGDWKYIVRMNDGFEELYDLSADPDERINVAETNAATTRVYREFISLSRRYNARYYERLLLKK